MFSWLGLVPNVMEQDDLAIKKKKKVNMYKRLLLKLCEQVIGFKSRLAFKLYSYPLVVC